MARIAVSGDTLTVQLHGMEQFWALKRRVEVPRASIVRVAIDPAQARRPKGLRMPGSYWPGVIAAGTYRWRGRRDFWSVRHPDKAVVIDLANAPYTRLVIEVDDPQATVSEIAKARS